MRKSTIPLITRKCKMCDNTFEVKENSTKTYCSKLCCQADPVTKENIRTKQKLTFQKKYNGKHPMSLPETQAKHRATLKQKYGVEHALQSKACTDKAKATKQTRYGDINYNNNNKCKQTKLEKYGNENYNGHEKRTETKYESILEHWKHLTPMFTEVEFTGVTFKQRYKFNCNECDYEFDANLNNGYIPRCKPCAMKSHVNKQSKGEKEIIEYIKSISTTKIVERDRNVLNGKELDIYLPDKKIAIEFNGIFWHSESNIQNKLYHLHKTTQCAVRGISLLHIFDYQWYQKQNIVKSILASKLGTSTKIYARKCTIKPVKSKIKNEFINNTHIHGTCNSSINLGLYYNNELVAVATFGKSRYDKKYEYELFRYSSKLNTTVVGGFSKLLQFFIKTYKPKNILTYCDRALSSGNMYFKTGFTFLTHTKPNYFYFKNSSVFSREQFQKHMIKNKLPIFDQNLTEYVNMLNNGFDRIWDCGNYKFVYTTKL